MAEGRTCWVKIPDKPTVYAMIVTFDSLVRQLQKCDLQSKVKGIRISAADKAIRVEVEANAEHERADEGRNQAD